MKKPLNWVTIILWVLAVAIPTLEAIDVVFLNGLRVEAMGPALHKAETYWFISSVVTQVRVAIMNIAVLGGLGYLIEIADQVRWEWRGRSKL